MSKNWDKIVEKFGGLPHFGNADVAQILEKDEGEVKQILLRYQKSGKILRIKRGVYMTREFYWTNKNDVNFPTLIASLVAPNGYLSTEYVLYRHGSMTEVVMLYTGVTVGMTQRVSNFFGSYNYRHIKPELIGGYQEQILWGVKTRAATLGKALFDYLYLREGGAYHLKDFDLTEELRLNIYDWEDGDRADFAEWVERSGSRKMKNALTNIRRNVWT